MLVAVAGRFVRRHVRMFALEANLAKQRPGIKAGARRASAPPVSRRENTGRPDLLGIAATAKRIRLVHPHHHHLLGGKRSTKPGIRAHDGLYFGQGHDGTLPLRISGDSDLRAILAGSRAICLAPAQRFPDKPPPHPHTHTWRISGDATLRFSDLQEDATYVLVHMGPPGRQPSRPGDANLRGELRNRAFGEEGELNEAMLRIFSPERGFPDMVSKQEWRIVQNEEVDAVISSPRALAIGFHCNKLTLGEVQGASKRVSTWIQKANTCNSLDHSFLLGKDIYVVMSGNFLPKQEAKRVIPACQKHNFILLLKNGINFSMENSCLPPQQIFPANV